MPEITAPMFQIDSFVVLYEETTNPEPTDEVPNPVPVTTHHRQFVDPSKEEDRETFSLISGLFAALQVSVSDRWLFYAGKKYHAIPRFDVDLDEDDET